MTPPQGFFFLVLFLFVGRCGYVDKMRFLIGHSLLAWPCERMEQEAEAGDCRGLLEARDEDGPRLLFTWSAVKTGHYPGHYSESCKLGQAATIR